MAMKMAFVRHLSSIMLLPFVVVVVIPTLILRARPAWDEAWQTGEWSPTLRIVGCTLAALGVAWATWCIVLFGVRGRGTLAPWDPPTRLVVVGPYRHMRNPMISGVLLMLIGIGFVFGSVLVLLWAAMFFVINSFYFVFVEEPGLERRFGPEYVRYRAHVPRWIPRWRGWDEDRNDLTG